MKALHIFLQGKGGCGKTFGAVCLAQFLLKNGIPIACFDTDPVNSTFVSFKKLAVKHEEIRKDNKIDPNLIKDFFINLLKIIKVNNDKENFQIVIDNGAASFLPILDFLKKSKAISAFKNKGNTVFLHVPLAGGSGAVDTFHGLATLFKTFPKDCEIVIWENPKDGAVKYNGITFEESELYKQNASRIKEIIKIPTFDDLEETSLKEDIMGKHLTFSEATSSALLEEDEDLIFDIGYAESVQEKIFASISVVGKLFL